MEAVLTTFGIDWHLLLINMVNFGILLFVLWYFLYSPVIKMLEDRREKVSQGVRDANAATLLLEQTRVLRTSVLARAGKEADELVAAARAAGIQKEREFAKKGEASAVIILREAEARAEELKIKAIEESKREVAKLIILGIEKVGMERLKQ